MAGGGRRVLPGPSGPCVALQRPLRISMTTAGSVPKITIGELEANYSLYCKAMRLLLREGKSMNKIRRTVCWQRLETLHNCLPGQYRDPDYLCTLLAREMKAP